MHKHILLAFVVLAQAGLCFREQRAWRAFLLVINVASGGPGMNPELGRCHLWRNPWMPTVRGSRCRASHAGGGRPR